MIDELDLALMCDDKYSEDLELAENVIENMSTEELEQFTEETSDDAHDYSEVTHIVEEFEIGDEYIDSEVEDLLDDIIDEFTDSDGSVIDSVASVY